MTFKKEERYIIDVPLKGTHSVSEYYFWAQTYLKVKVLVKYRILMHALASTFGLDIYYPITSYSGAYTFIRS